MIKNTAEKRESLNYMMDYKEILDDIASDKYLKQNWQNYLQDNPYVVNIKLEDTIEVLKEIFKKIKI